MLRSARSTLTRRVTPAHHRCHSNVHYTTPVVLDRESKVAFIGIGAIGSPIAGKITETFPNCHVYARTGKTVLKHCAEHGSIKALSLREAIKDADIVVTCLPTSDEVQFVVDEVIKSEPKPGTLFLDTTSGSMAQSQAFEKELWRESIFYVDCAVSGGPGGARKAILTSFVGGNESAATACSDVINCYTKKLVYLGPAGAGHATKAINNILLATQNWAASEGMAVLKKKGVNLHQALEAINESSGRSWSSMQRMPDNILSQKFDYGFSVGLHRKDCEAAHDLMKTENGVMTTPVLTNTRTLMNMAVEELGPDADHTQVAQLVERWNGVKLE